jgi:hypothetical protein
MLAMVLQDLGQLEEARDLLRRAHRVYLSRFGRITRARRPFGETPVPGIARFIPPVLGATQSHHAQ